MEHNAYIEFALQYLCLFHRRHHCRHGLFPNIPTVVLLSTSQLPGSLGVSFDTKGNIAVQATGVGGVTTGTPGASITLFKASTNAPSIKNLEGKDTR
jgi:hypothetical protein